MLFVCTYIFRLSKGSCFLMFLVSIFVFPKISNCYFDCTSDKNMGNFILFTYLHISSIKLETCMLKHMLKAALQQEKWQHVYSQWLWRWACHHWAERHRRSGGPAWFCCCGSSVCSSSSGWDRTGPSACFGGSGPSDDPPPPPPPPQQLSRCGPEQTHLTHLWAQRAEQHSQGRAWGAAVWHCGDTERTEDLKLVCHAVSRWVLRNEKGIRPW